MRCVLDSSAMIAYLWDEEGAEVRESLLANPQVGCYAHAVHVCEVYDQLLRHSSESEADSILAALLGAGVFVRIDMDTEVWKQAARFKSLGRIALADCFCLALAGRLNAMVVTADRRKFEPLTQEQSQPVLFIH